MFEIPPDILGARSSRATDENKSSGTNTCSCFSEENDPRPNDRNGDISMLDLRSFSMFIFRFRAVNAAKHTTANATTPIGTNIAVFCLAFARDESLEDPDVDAGEAGGEKTLAGVECNVVVREGGGFAFESTLDVIRPGVSFNASHCKASDLNESHKQNDMCSLSEAVSMRPITS